MDVHEAGIKWASLNERARLNGVVFFTDYTDLQVQTPVRPGVFDIANAATATIRGLELEAEVQAAPRWRLGGHAAWIDARYDRYVAVGPGNTPVDAAGRRLFNAPEYSGRTFLEYQSQLGAAGALSLWLEASCRARSISQLSTTQSNGKARMVSSTRISRFDPVGTGLSAFSPVT